MNSRPRVLASTIATIIATAIPLLAPSRASADLNWDSANATNTWTDDGITLNWLDAGAVAAPWADDQLAIFAGTGETVTINSPFSPVVAGGLRFDVGGYTITGSGANGTLTLGAPGVAVSNAGDIATISAIINGTAGLTKTGAGILTLSGNNTFSGELTLNGGSTRLIAVSSFSGGINLNAGATLEMSSGGADTAAYNNFLGAASNGLVFDGGTYLANAATTASVDRTLTNRNITVNAGGATFDIAGAYPNFAEGIFNQVRFNNASVLSGTGTLTKNGGGRLQFQNGSAPNFSGAVVINNGTVEAAGTALGNASATNTITINGGNFAVSGATNQKIILSGGAISTGNDNRTVGGQVQVTATSYVFANDFYRDVDSANPARSLGWRMTIAGQLTGSADLGVAVNRAAYQSNSGGLVLQNLTNDYSGTITVGKNLRLENNPTGGVGKTLGAASVALADGGLILRDNGSDSSGTLDYGNNVSVIAPTGIFNGGTLAGSAFIDANRAGGTNTGNTFRLGSLALGNRSLTIQGGNGYGVEFAGASQLTDNATLNITTAPLTFSGGLGEDVTGGRSLTKTGAGTLNFTSNATYTGATIINGGNVTVGGAAGRLTGTSGITLTSGASLHIDNSGSNLADRISNAVPISMTGATLTFSSQTGAAVNGAETLGALTLTGTNTITLNQGDAGAVAALTVASLSRQNHATVNFAGSNFGLAGNSSRFVITDQTTDTPFLGAWVTVGKDYAQYVAASDAGGIRGVTAVASLTDPANDSGFAASTNLRLTTNTTTSLTADRSLNTVNFANTVNTSTLALGANKLTLAGSGILVGTNAASITGTTGSLTAGTSELIITNHAALAIGATIADNGANSVGLLKTGTGALTLSGANTFTGDTVINEGTLVLSNVSDTGSAGSLGSGGTLRLSNASVVTPLQFTGASASTNHPVAIGAPGALVNVTTAASTLTLSGPVSGSSLTVSGAGTLALSGATVLTGDLNVGNGNSGNNGVLKGIGGGTLSVGSGSTSSINIGSEVTATSANLTGTADLSGLSSFSANVGVIRIGTNLPSGDGSGTIAGTLILPANSTIVASTSIVVADSTGDGNGGIRGTLTFGSGTTNVTTPLLTIGGRKYSASSTIGSGGTLILGSAAARTTLNVAANTVDTGTSPSSTFNLTGGAIQANLAGVTVGHKSGGGALGKVTGTLDLGTSAATDVNISVTSGSAVRIGLLEYGGGAQPTSEQANGTLIIGGGKMTINSTVTGSSAVVVGNFSASAKTTDATANNAAAGTLTINGGNVTINSGGTANAINLGALGLAADSVGTNTSSGTLNLNGGSLTVNNQITGNSGNSSSTSTVNITGGTLNMSGKNLTNINNLTFSGGTIRNLATLNRALTQTGESSLLDVAGNNASITGGYAVTDGDVNIATGRSLTVGGTGTTLSGTATLTVNGSITGSLTVNAGSTVTGSGTTGALTLAGGAIAPGNSPGILNTGALSLGGGTLSLELNDATAGTGYDQINVTGGVSLTANTAFTLTLGFTPAMNSTFVLINNDGTDAITGAGRLVFGGVTLNEGAIFDVGGSSFRISYAGGSSNNDIVLQTVPEPSTAVALFGGIGTLLGLQRFRRKSR